MRLTEPIIEKISDTGPWEKIKESRSHGVVESLSRRVIGSRETVIQREGETEKIRIKKQKNVRLYRKIPIYK